MLKREKFFESEREIFTAMRDKGFRPRGIIDIGASNGSWSRYCMEIFPDAQYRMYEPLCSRVENYRQGHDAMRSAARTRC